jgi:hypothetical protein
MDSAQACYLRRNEMKRSTVLLALLTGFQGACMHTIAVRERPGDFLASQTPGSATVTLAEGNPIVVNLPRVVMDTIFGWSKGQEVSIPVQDVKEVRVRKVSVVRNAIIGGVVVGGGMAALFTATKKNSTPSTIPDQSCGGQEPDERCM